MKSFERDSHAGLTGSPSPFETVNASRLHDDDDDDDDSPSFLVGGPAYRAAIGSSDHGADSTSPYRQFEDPAAATSRFLSSSENANTLSSHSHGDDADKPQLPRCTRISIWLIFWTLGLINNFGYVVVLSAAKSLAESFDASNLIGVLQWANVGFGLVAKFANAAFFLDSSYSIRMIINTAFMAGGLAITAISTRVGFELAVIGILLIGTSSAFGESVLLGYFKHYDPSLTGAWSSGTGGAGVFGTLAFLLLHSVLKFSNLTIFLLLAPLAAVYLFCFFLLYTRFSPDRLASLMHTSVPGGPIPAQYGQITTPSAPVNAVPLGFPSPRSHASNVGDLSSPAIIRGGPRLRNNDQGGLLSDSTMAYGTPHTGGLPGSFVRPAPSHILLAPNASPSMLPSSGPATPSPSTTAAHTNKARALSEQAPALRLDGSNSHLSDVEGQADSGCPSSYLLGSRDVSGRTAGSTAGSSRRKEATVSHGTFNEQTSYGNDANTTAGDMEQGTNVVTSSTSEDMNTLAPAGRAALPITTRLKLIFPAVRNPAILLSLVYFFEYVACVGFANKANPNPEPGNWWAENAYEVIAFCYQIGVLISRSSISVIQVKRIDILCLVQGLMFVVWLFQALLHFMPLGLQFGSMIFIGLLGGGMYVNVFHGLLFNQDLSADREVSTPTGVMVIRSWLCFR